MAESGTSNAQDSKGLNLSLKKRVGRKLILAGILPKLSDLGQGAIGEASGFIGRCLKELCVLEAEAYLDRLIQAGSCQKCPYNVIADAEMVAPNLCWSNSIL